ncbi:MAG TPA: septum formation initiator family protein [Candidatus Pacearchaeota archaeon]|nr:septum formation initiator family protein [Candidatus Pacearchaeota archaeon]
MIAKKRKKEKSVFQKIAEKVKVLLWIALIGFLVYTNVNIFLEIEKGGKDLKKLKATTESLNKEKEKLNFELGNTNSEAYLEKVAREELGLQKPGEQVIVIKKEGEEVKSEEEKSNFQFFKNVWEQIKKKLPG